MAWFRPHPVRSDGATLCHASERAYPSSDSRSPLSSIFTPYVTVADRAANSCPVALVEPQNACLAVNYQLRSISTNQFLSLLLLAACKAKVTSDRIVRFSIGLVK